MRRFTIGIVTVAVVAVGVAGVAARQPSVTASGGWIAEPLSSDISASAYFSLQNPTMYDVYVVSVTSKTAGQVEFRETVPGGSESTVNQLTVPAYGSVELGPNGVHVVLTDLRRRLKAGDTVLLTLTTDGGAVVIVTAVVRKR